MADMILEIAKWAAPSVGAWILAQTPTVRSWAKSNWTKAVILMTATASFSIIGFSFYIYYQFLAPYIMICEKANNCISVSAAEINEIQGRSDATIIEIERVFSDGSDDGRRNAHIRFTREWAHKTDDAIKALSSRVNKKTQ